MRKLFTSKRISLKLKKKRITKNVYSPEYCIGYIMKNIMLYDDETFL